MKIIRFLSVGWIFFSISSIFTYDKLVNLVEVVTNLQKQGSTVNKSTVFRPVDPRKQEALNIINSYKERLQLNNDCKGLMLLQMYENESKYDALEIYKAETQYLDFLFKDQMQSLYNNIQIQYPELHRFIKIFQCDIPLVTLEKDYVIKKRDGISRIINSYRAQKVIDLNKLTFIGVPRKCLVVKDYTFLCYAQKINAGGANNLTVLELKEAKAQLNKFVELTGYSDFVDSENIVYVPAEKKYYFVDLEDTSFLKEISIKNSTKYDTFISSLNLNKVKEEESEYTASQNSLRYKFYREKEKELQEIKVVLKKLSIF